jgi:hypothetical protein
MLSGVPRIFLKCIHFIEQSIKSYQKAVLAFFHYIFLLRKAPPQEWIFDELKIRRTTILIFRLRVQLCSEKGRLEYAYTAPYEMDSQWV